MPYGVQRRRRASSSRLTSAPGLSLHTRVMPPLSATENRRETKVRILVVGASRGVGRDVVRAALAEGHLVRAFARSAQTIRISHANLEKRNGDALREADVAAALH